ncbi:MAG: hypothetical protein BWY54_00046 [Candidatus Dependentiae bacterium ADurb.Bin331]|nr:MAG: hypothetical protein BWY54_00046 [Candidatus Dependentiae bacterium ADurb.Bin331]
MKKLLIILLVSSSNAVQAMETTHNVIIQTSEGPLSLDLTQKQFEWILKDSLLRTGSNNPQASQEEIEQIAKTFPYNNLTKAQVQNMIEFAQVDNEIDVITADGLSKYAINETQLDALTERSIVLKNLLEDTSIKKIGKTIRVPDLTKNEWQMVVNYLPILQQISTDPIMGQKTFVEKIKNASLDEIIDLLNAADDLNIPDFYLGIIEQLKIKYAPFGKINMPKSDSKLLQRKLNPNVYHDLIKSIDLSRDVTINTSEGPLTLNLNQEQYKWLFDWVKDTESLVKNRSLTKDEIRSLEQESFPIFQNYPLEDVKKFIYNAPIVTRRLIIKTTEGLFPLDLTEKQFEQLLNKSETIKHSIELNQEEISNEIMLPSLTQEQIAVLQKHLYSIANFYADKSMWRFEEQIKQTPLQENIELMNALDYLDMQEVQNFVINALVDSYLPSGYLLSPLFDSQQLKLLQEQLKPTVYQDFKDALDKRINENKQRIIPH